MREINFNEACSVCGGELTIHVGTDGISAEGTLSDWGNAISGAWNWMAYNAPTSAPYVIRVVTQAM